MTTSSEPMSDVFSRIIGILLKKDCKNLIIWDKYIIRPRVLINKWLLLSFEIRDKWNRTESIDKETGTS